MMDRGSRNNAGKQETTKSALGSFLLAMATFLPSPGCTTSNSVGKQDDRPGSTAQDTSPHAQPKSPNANFIHNPEPRELLEACQKSLPNSVLRLNPEGNGVQIQLSTTASGGQTINGFRDLFWPGQKVVISTKNGMPYIQEKVEAANGDQLERYTWAGVERPQTIAELGDVSFKQLAKVADSDRDGNITVAELRNAIKDPNVQGQDAQFLAAVLPAAEQMEKLGDEKPGIGNSDFAALADPENNRLHRLINQRLLFSGALVGQAQTLYGEKGYPTPFDAGAAPSIYNQHLIAAFNAICAVRPEDISSMIRQKGSGEGYAVRLGGKDVDVSSPTESELITFTRCGKDGYWMAVLVKAYGKLLGEARRTSEINSESNFQNPSNHADPGRVMENIGCSPVTVRSFSSIWGFGLTPDQIHQALVRATRESRAVCLGTACRGYFGPKQIGDVKFEANQLYAVIGYDQEKREIIVLDPNRKIINDTLSEDAQRGVFRIPVARINEIFRRMFIEGGSR